jgi:hypothetical protein
MIVDDLYVVSVSFFPHKANPPLVIDTNAVLPFAVSLERMKSVAARRAQIHQVFRRAACRIFTNFRTSSSLNNVSASADLKDLITPKEYNGIH